MTSSDKQTSIDSSQAGSVETFPYISCRILQRFKKSAAICYSNLHNACVWRWRNANQIACCCAASTFPFSRRISWDTNHHRIPFYLNLQQNPDEKIYEFKHWNHWNASQATASRLLLLPPFLRKNHISTPILQAAKDPDPFRRGRRKVCFPLIDVCRASNSYQQSIYVYIYICYIFHTSVCTM